MYHTKIQPGSDLRDMPTGELALRAYLSEHEAALGHAAVLLADRRGARLINGIKDGLGQPGPLTTRLRRRLLELRGLLFLEHGDDSEEFDLVAILEPDDPAVPEICLLADGLDDALRSAAIFPTPDFRVA
ncbi:hypothetical protein [Primorskyibacter marinus]|uniref:hypothetical protein n=1 Tax=Primorskyibacter marinus TaxID=1977320 RepID=UPI001300BA60|nr:hypothetical protein [Primorskyibacter marinus]